MRALLVLTLLAGGAMAQPAPMRISGVVAEPGIAGAPIADAEVTLDYYGPQQPRFMPSPPQNSTIATTTATGGFVFQVGQAGSTAFTRGRPASTKRARAPARRRG